MISENILTYNAIYKQVKFSNYCDLQTSKKMLGRSYRSAALSWSSSLLSNQPSSAITTSGTKNAILPITYLLPASHKKDSHESEFTDWNFEAKKYVFSPFSVLFSWFASAENHPKWRWERQNDHHRRSSYTIQTDEGPSGTLHFFLKCQNLDLCTYLSQHIRLHSPFRRVTRRNRPKYREKILAC